MRKTLLTLSLMAFALIGKAQNCSELFFSEYVEGGQNDKAIEIYNPTNNPITLNDNYRIVRYKEGVSETASNTSSQAVKVLGDYVVIKKLSNTNSVLATETHIHHTIQPHDVWVLIIQKLDSVGMSSETPVSPILITKAAADTAHFAFICPVYNTSYAMSFNGNDAISLQKNVGGNWVYVDIFGQAGHNPNTVSPTNSSGYWTDCAIYDFDQTANTDCGYTHNWTQDRSLVRKGTVMHGVTVNPAPFNPTLEWAHVNDVDHSVPDWWNNSTGTADGTVPAPITYTTNNQLGAHICDCGNSPQVGVREYEKSGSQVKVFPNPASGSDVTFMSADKNMVEIKVLSIYGHEVRVVKLGRNVMRTEQNLNLASGVYYTQVLFEDKTVAIEKLIVE